MPALHACSLCCGSRACGRLPTNADAASLSVAACTLACSNLIDKSRAVNLGFVWKSISHEVGAVD